MASIIDHIMQAQREYSDSIEAFRKLPMSRKDENGTPCPGTLGEYIDVCDQIAPGSKATQFLEAKILESPNGRDEVVEAPDSQMRALLWPMIRESVMSEAAQMEAEAPV